MHTAVPLTVRTATPDDAPAATAVLQRAYTQLLAGYYDPAILAAALPSMTQANPALLASGTWYIAEAFGRMAGCGGWTFEKPGTRERHDGLAHLRHFATDPDSLRMGVGAALYRHCAAKAAACGATRFQAFACLNAEPFYSALGFRRVRMMDVPMGTGVRLAAVLMECLLDQERAGGDVPSPPATPSSDLP